MKNGRKILSIILTICMVMQILPVFATEGEVPAPAPGGGAGGSGINYLINDDFGAQTETDKITGLDGWEIIGDNGLDLETIPSDTVTTTPIEGEDGNYALKYVVNGNTWKDTHISKALETPVTFTDGTDVVIEMRVMQDSGNVYDAETGELTTVGTGRSFFKYNYQTVSGSDEYNYQWGTLWYNDAGKLSFVNGWTASGNETDGYYYTYPTGFMSAYNATTNPHSKVVTDATDKWYTYKIVIHGTTGGVANTADYILTDDDGDVKAELKNKNIDFPDNAIWGSATGAQGPDWVEDVLNTIDFRQRNANTLYVDYVRVYEAKQESVQANLVNGRYVQFDEDIELNLTTEAESLTLIEETAKLTTAAGAEVGASVSYDAVNKILSVDPTEDLIPGTIYSLTFTDNDFNKFTGKKTFELEARAARSYGMVVNDTFDDLELGTTDNASGWYLSSNVDAAYKGSIEIAEETGATGKVLKVTGKMDGGTVANNKQTYLTKKIGGGIEYKEGTEVIIRTRVKHTNNTARMVMVANRPDSSILPTNALGANLYNLFVANTNSGVDVYTGTAGGGTQGGSSKLANGVDLSNVWLDVELTIDGYNQEMDAVVKAYDEAGTTVVGTYTASDLKLVRTASVFENHYGTGTTKAAFDALERLGFTFRNSSTEDTLYIDEIKVYEVYTDVKVSVDETVKPGEAIDVTFDVPNGDASFLDAVKLYNGETEIADITKSINEAKNVVTIDAGTLEDGAYKVKVDTTNIPTEAYNITETTATFYVMDKEYLIYDEFGKDDDEGWEMEQYATNDSTIGLKDEGNGNYSLQMTSTNNANAMNTYYTRRLDTPIPFENGKNIVIETKFMQEGGSAGDGRAYFKFNMPTDTQQNGDVNLNWGTLAYMQSNNGVPTLYTPSVQSWGATPTETTYMTPLTIDTTDVNNTWYEVKVTINGNTKTAAYEIKDVTHNEVFTNTIKNADIDHFNHASFEEEILNSIDFRLRNANTFYVDYVKVWEYTSSNVRVNTVEGKTFEAGKAIEFKVTAAEGTEVSDTIVDTVTVNTEATVAYENGILKVTPEAAEGDTVTVTFADNDYVKYVDSTTSFTLTARGERETGVIINDTFDGENAATTLDGWVEGESNIKTDLAVDTTTFEGKKVLKISTQDAADEQTLGNQVIAYRKLGNGVAIKEGTPIIIKTKVYQTATNTTSTGRFDLRFNRPNTTTLAPANDHQWLNYGLFRQQNNALKYITSYASSNNMPNAYTNAKVTGTTADFNPANKWVEYTITIENVDGVDDKAKIAAVADDGTSTTVYGVLDFPPAVYEDLNGKGATAAEYYVKALESLTFKNTSNEPIYIDYIKVYEQTTARANLVDGRYFEAGEPIKVAITAANELTADAVIETAALTQSGTVNDATMAYEDGILTITPAGTVTAGDRFTLTLTDNDDISYTGTTSFELEARAARSNGIVFNDTFDNLEVETGVTEASGWYLGAVEDGITKGTLDIVQLSEGNNALVVNVNDSTSTTNAEQTNLTKKYGGGIEYKENTDIIIKARIKNATTSESGENRAMLMLNRPDSVEQVGAFGNNIFAWFCVRNTGMTSVKNYSTANGQPNTNMYSNVLFTENLLNSWVNVEMRITNGGAYTITATKEVEDGDDVTSDTLSGDVTQHPEIYEFFYGEGTDVTAFDALERLTFIFRDSYSQKLYIDYIEVYEQASVRANLSDGRYFEAGAPIEVKLTSENALTEADVKTSAEFSDENADISFDATTNILTITPSAAQAGDIFKLAFVDSDDMLFTGTTSFELEARGARQTEAIRDTFDNDNVTDGRTASGWYLGLTDANTEKGTLEIVPEEGAEGKALKFTGDFYSTGNNQQSYLTKKLGGGFVYEEGAEIVIKTRMKHKNATRAMLLLNRPDSLDLPGAKTGATAGTFGGNLYTAVSIRDDVPANYGLYYATGVSNDSSVQVGLSSKPIIEGAFANRWVDIELRINGNDMKASFKTDDMAKAVTVNGSIKQPTCLYEHHYGTGTEVDVFDALYNLGFTLRAADDEIFIDYVEVYKETLVDESATAKFMNGETEVKAITEDGSVTPTFEIQSKNNETAEYYIIAAKYEDGRLADTQMKSVTVTGKQTVTLDAIEVDKDNTGLVVKAFVWSENMVPVCKQAEIKPTVYTIYMAADGDDANEGYASTPVATLNRAIELANTAKTNGYATSEVIIADGNYELTGKTISIGSNLKADSLTVRAENPKGAKFINGVAYKLSEATSAPEDIKNRLSNQNVRDQLYAINLLSNPKVTEADIPQMNLPGSYSYAVMASNAGNKDANGAQIINITEPELAANELFYDGKAMTVARYPNTTYETLTEGSFTFAQNSVTRNWADDKSAGDEYILPADRVATPFTVTLEQAKNWGGANQALMFGFWYHDWATQTVPVGENGIDTTTGVITSKYPSHYGLKAGGRYYVYNLLEEIDVEGEYFIDRNPDSDTFGMMYFIKPTGEADEIIMSLYGDESNGIIDISASNVTVKDLVFTASRGKAIRAYGNNVIIDNCEISNTGTTAVSLSGTNSVIQNCTIHDVNGGISLGGGSTNNLTPGNNKALNNTITNFSRLNKTYTDAIQVTGMGNVAEGNTISQGEHLAMRISGVQNVIRNNDISHVLKEADDMGAIYAGRSWTSRDNVIEYNYIHDLESTEVGAGDSAIGGIFLDDHFADVTIRGNIFDTISGHGIRLNQGREHIIENNIFINLDGYSVSGSEGTGLASSYGTHIAGVRALLAFDAWKNHENYAAELFNEAKTDYNPDLLWTRGIKVINNYTGNCAGVAELTDANGDNGTITTGNGLTNAVLTTKAAIKSEVENRGGTFVFDNMPLSKIGITE